MRPSNSTEKQHLDVSDPQYVADQANFFARLGSHSSSSTRSVAAVPKKSVLARAVSGRSAKEVKKKYSVTFADGHGGSHPPAGEPVLRARSESTSGMVAPESVDDFLKRAQRRSRKSRLPAAEVDFDQESSQGEATTLEASDRREATAVVPVPPKSYPKSKNPFAMPQPELREGDPAVMYAPDEHKAASSLGGQAHRRLQFSIAPSPLPVVDAKPTSAVESGLTERLSLTENDFIDQYTGILVSAVVKEEVSQSGRLCYWGQPTIVFGYEDIKARARAILNEKKYQGYRREITEPEFEALIAECWNLLPAFSLTLQAAYSLTGQVAYWRYFDAWLSLILFDVLQGQRADFSQHQWSEEGFDLPAQKLLVREFNRALLACHQYVASFVFIYALQSNMIGDIPAFAQYATRVQLASTEYRNLFEKQLEDNYYRAKVYYDSSKEQATLIIDPRVISALFALVSNGLLRVDFSVVDYQVTLAEFFCTHVQRSIEAGLPATFIPTVFLCDTQEPFDPQIHDSFPDLGIPDRLTLFLLHLKETLACLSHYSPGERALAIQSLRLSGPGWIHRREAFTALPVFQIRDYAALQGRVVITDELLFMRLRGQCFSAEVARDQYRSFLSAFRHKFQLLTLLPRTYEIPEVIEHRSSLYLESAFLMPQMIELNSLVSTIDGTSNTDLMISVIQSGTSLVDEIHPRVFWWTIQHPNALRKLLEQSLLFLSGKPNYHQRSITLANAKLLLVAYLLNQGAKCSAVTARAKVVKQSEMTGLSEQCFDIFNLINSDFSLDKTLIRLFFSIHQQASSSSEIEAVTLDHKDHPIRRNIVLLCQVLRDWLIASGHKDEKIRLLSYLASFFLDPSILMEGSQYRAVAYELSANRGNISEMLYATAYVLFKEQVQAFFGIPATLMAIFDRSLSEFSKLQCFVSAGEASKTDAFCDLSFYFGPQYLFRPETDSVVMRQAVAPTSAAGKMNRKLFLHPDFRRFFRGFLLLANPDNYREWAEMVLEERFFFKDSIRALVAQHVPKPDFSSANYTQALEDWGQRIASLADDFERDLINALFDADNFVWLAQELEIAPAVRAGERLRRDQSAAHDGSAGLEMRPFAEAKQDPDDLERGDDLYRETKKALKQFLVDDRHLSRRESLSVIEKRSARWEDWFDQRLSTRFENRFARITKGMTALALAAFFIFMRGVAQEQGVGGLSNSRVLFIPMFFLFGLTVAWDWGQEMIVRFQPYRRKSPMTRNQGALYFELEGETQSQALSSELAQKNKPFDFIYRIPRYPAAAFMITVTMIVAEGLMVADYSPHALKTFPNPHSPIASIAGWAAIGASLPAVAWGLWSALKYLPRLILENEHYRMGIFGFLNSAAWVIILQFPKLTEAHPFILKQWFWPGIPTAIFGLNTLVRICKMHREQRGVMTFNLAMAEKKELEALPPKGIGSAFKLACKEVYNPSVDSLKWAIVWTGGIVAAHYAKQVPDTAALNWGLIANIGGYTNFIVPAFFFRILLRMVFASYWSYQVLPDKASSPVNKR